MIVSIGLWIAGLVGKSGIGQKAAKIVGACAIILGIVVAMLLALHFIRKDAVDNYKVERNAEVTAGTLAADRKANAAEVQRQNDFANSQANIAGSMSNAIVNDPNHGNTVAGPVTQSYFDSVRRERDRPARSK